MLICIVPFYYLNNNKAGQFYNLIENITAIMVNETVKYLQINKQII